MESSRAALFLDFDNVFGGLHQVDPQAARLFAESPGVWLSKLQANALAASSRRWLVLRCYLNPVGWVPDPSEPKGRLYFSRWRPNFVRAGFEVVDCPPLTARQKNAADLRMALDIVDALTASQEYDEFVIGSGDSDFTPLLLRLRAADKRSTIISPSTAAEAYVAIADHLVNGEETLALLGVDIVDGDPEFGPGNTQSTPESDEADRFRRLVNARYEAARAPIHLSSLAQQVLAEIGGADQTAWPGNDTFSRAVERLGLQGAQIAENYLWDARRHQTPQLVRDFDAPSSIQRLCKVSNVPRLSPTMWRTMFAVMAEYAATHEFNLSESTKWIRDELDHQGLEVGRGAVAYAVRGVALGGAPLHRDPRPDADELAGAFTRNVLTGGLSSRLTFTDAEISEIFAWFAAHRKDV